MGLVDGLLGGRKVTMIVSVGEHVAGESYRLSAETADRYIARGYAAGSLSREYAEHEMPALQGNAQVVQV
jgi:hypothetical protein